MQGSLADESKLLGIETIQPISYIDPEVPLPGTISLVRPG
jgi:hypothetical protein